MSVFTGSVHLRAGLFFYLYTFSLPFLFSVRVSLFWAHRTRSPEGERQRNTQGQGVVRVAEKKKKTSEIS